MMLPLLGGAAGIDAVPVVDNGLDGGGELHAVLGTLGHAAGEDALRPAARRSGRLPDQNQSEWRLEDLQDVQGQQDRQDRHDHDLQDEQDEMRHLWERLLALAHRAGWREPIPPPPPIPGVDDKPSRRGLAREHIVDGSLAGAPERLSLSLGTEPEGDAVATATGTPPATARPTDADGGRGGRRGEEPVARTALSSSLGLSLSRRAAE